MTIDRRLTILRAQVIVAAMVAIFMVGLLARQWSTYGLPWAMHLPAPTEYDDGFEHTRPAGVLLSALPAPREFLNFSLHIRNSTLRHGHTLMLSNGEGIEFVKVGELLECKDQGDCQYSVTRNLDGNGAKDWPAGAHVDLVP